MNRLIAIIVVAVAGSLVAACGLTGTSVIGQAAQDTTDSTDETQPQEHPAGFYLSGEFVELTEFDPEDPGLESIRACEEIPQEIFDELGFGPGRSEQGEGFGMTGCTFEVVNDPEPRSLVTFIGGPSRVQDLLDESVPNQWNDVSSIPGLITHQHPMEVGESCAASVDTSRGLFSVTWTEMMRDVPDEEMCRKALDIAETIITKLRGK